MYLITHPKAGCNTEIGGIRFVNGKAETDLAGVLLSFAATPAEAVEKFEAMGFKVVEAKQKGTKPDESAGAG